jgi:hypothetical protein
MPSIRILLTHCCGHSYIPVEDCIVSVSIVCTIKDCNDDESSHDAIAIKQRPHVAMHYAVCCALHCVIHMVQAGTVTSHMHCNTVYSHDTLRVSHYLKKSLPSSFCAASRDRAYAPLSHRALVVCCLSLPSTLRCVSFRKPNDTAASNQAYFGLCLL